MFANKKGAERQDLPQLKGAVSSSFKNLDTVTFALKENQVYFYLSGDEYLWEKYGYKDGAAKIIDTNLNKLKDSDLSHVQVNTSRWGSDKYGRTLKLLVRHLDKKMSTCELVLSEI